MDNQLILYNVPTGAQKFNSKKNNIFINKGINLKIVQCPICGIIQILNKPVNYYKKVIRAVAYSEEMKEFRIKQFKNFLEKYNLINKKILEVGCGKGEYLILMNQCGASTYGIEGDSNSVKLALNLGLNVENKFINKINIKLKNSPFDGFYILNYLEHIPDPNTLLKGIYNNLSEEGIGLVEVPNFNMIYEKKLFAEFIIDHIFYFTKETLKLLLEINGFEVIECEEIWHNYIISMVVKKRKKIDFSIFNSQLYNYKKEVHNYIKQFNRIAIWGAGHQSLTFISLLDLKDKIKYIIDSAQFKQGKYTPIFNIPIVSPEEINKNPIDLILIAAGSYSDEVASTIIKNNPKQPLAILREDKLEIL